MKHLAIAPLMLAGVVSSPACGPLFDDTLLDRPAAVLDVPVSPFTEQLLAIPFPTDVAAGLREHPLSRQAWRTPEHSLAGSEVVDVEVAELNRWWESQGTSDERRHEMVTAYRKWRELLAEGVTVAAPWGNAGPPDRRDPGPFAFASQLPDDVRRYLEGARAFREGRIPTARGLWRALLELPADQRPRRTLWAVWMLAKTADNANDATSLYQRLLELAADPQFADPLRLAASSAGWLAKSEPDPLVRLRWYAAAARAGRPDLVLSVRRLAGDLATTADPALLARAAADPLGRQLVTAHLASLLDSENPFSEGAGEHGDAADDPVGRWLTALEALPEKKLPNAVTVAWVCYSRAEFARARRWLKQAPPSHPDTLWLQAKLDFRDGHTAQAVALLKRAAAALRPPSARKPGRVDEVSWYDGASRQDYRLGQLHAELGIGLLAEGEVVQALEMIDRSGYFEDACYIGERLLSPDELKSWVTKRYPDWSDDCLQAGTVTTPGDRWRDLLGRRLCREFRFDEAREFIEPSHRAALDLYKALHELGRKPELEAKLRSAALWQEACVVRDQGMELLGTSGFPDYALYGGAFGTSSVGDLRNHPGIWPKMSTPTWDDGEEAHPVALTVPEIGREERDRFRRYSTVPDKRYHYRYIASELAWQAAKLLPDDDPSQAYMHNQGCAWLAARDPEAADRHYKALVRRNPHLLEGLEADRRRWFLPFLEKPPYLPTVPPSLLPPPAEP